MRKMSVPLLLFLLALAAPRAQDATTAFVNVTVIPMDRERVLEGQTVVVRGDTVVSMAPSSQVPPPSGAVVIDGRGRYLIPGLAEMHAHVPGGAATDEAMARVLFLYVANGITTARGMLGDLRHLALRAQLARGEVIGPTLYTSGPSFNGNTVPTKEAAIARVEEQKAAGYDFLKIHPGIRRDVFEALAATAQRSGIRFAGHVPLDLGLARALELRFATIDHIDGYVEALVRGDAPLKAIDSQWFGVNLARYADKSRIPALVEATRQAGTWIVPTQTLFEHGQGDDDPTAMAKWPEMRYVPPQQLEQWIAGKQKFLASPDGAAENRRQFLEVRRALLMALHGGGAGIVLGSDAPQVWNVPGFSIHRELRAMVEAGLTPWQALATGTRNVAAFFGTADRTGTISEGKRADLVLLDGNPLADIGNTARIAGVMVGGRWLPRAELDTRLARLAY
jgi:imidazolonepropionase-like amidohydrolase